MNQSEQKPTFNPLPTLISRYISENNIDLSALSDGVAERYGANSQQAYRIRNKISGLENGMIATVPAFSNWAEILDSTIEISIKPNTDGGVPVSVAYNPSTERVVYEANQDGLLIQDRHDLQYAPGVNNRQVVTEEEFNDIANEKTKLLLLELAAIAGKTIDFDNSDWEVVFNVKEDVLEGLRSLDVDVDDLPVVKVTE